MVSGKLYGYGELDEGARGRAFETWAGYRRDRSKEVEAVLEEEEASLRRAVESIGCKMMLMGVARDGSDGNVAVALGDLAEAAIRGEAPVPAAKDDGTDPGRGFAERWNHNDRDDLAAAVEEGRPGVADDYLGRALERAEWGLAAILDDLEYYTGEEWFARERDEGVREQLFEEDGTYVPGE